MEGLVAGFDLFDQLRRIFTHIGDKLLVAGLPPGDCGKLVLPAGRHLRRAQLLRDQLNQLKPLGGGDQLFAAAFDIEGRKQLLDNVRPRRGRPEAGGLLQDSGQVPVADGGGGMLHGGQQRRLRIAGGRLGFPRPERYGGNRQLVPLTQRRKPLLLFLLRLLFHAEAAVIGGAPALVKHMLAPRGEGFTPDIEGKPDLLILKRRHQHRQKAADHQIVDIPLRPAEIVEIRLFLGGDDGVVVGHPGVVYQIFDLQWPPAVNLLRQRLVDVHHAALQALRQGLHHIVGNVTGIGARIGQELVLLVKPLHDVQRLFRGVGVFFIRVPLQLREIIGGGRRHLLPGLLHPGQHLALALELCGQLLRLLSVKNGGVPLPVPPIRGKAVQLRRDTPVFPGDKAPDLLFPPRDERQRRRLYPAGGELSAPLAGEGAGDVQANQPVRLAAGLRGAVEAVVFRGRLEILKAFSDGLIRLGGDPQAPGPALPARLLHDPAGDKLPLASSIGGDNELCHIAPLHEAGDRLVLPARLRDHHQLHGLGEHGQILHVPLFPLFFIYVRIGQGHKMAEGPGHDIPVPLHISVSASCAAQHAGQLTPDGGLLRQNQCFCHVVFAFPRPVGCPVGQRVHSTIRTPCGARAWLRKKNCLKMNNHAKSQVPMREHRHLKLSTKCRQLERQKWELPKKFPFLHGLYVKGDSPSPFTDPPCKTNLVCKGLSTV